MITNLVFAEQKYYLQVRYYDDTAYGRVEQVVNYPIPKENNPITAICELMKKDMEDFNKDEQAGVQRWITEKQNPPPVYTPTKEDYINLYNQQMASAQDYLNQYATVASKEDLEKVKVSMEQKVTDLTTAISAKATAIEE